MSARGTAEITAHRVVMSVLYLGIDSFRAVETDGSPVVSPLAGQEVRPDNVSVKVFGMPSDPMYRVIMDMQCGKHFVQAYCEVSFSTHPFCVLADVCVGDTRLTPRKISFTRSGSPVLSLAPNDYDLKSVWEEVCARIP